MLLVTFGENVIFGLVFLLYGTVKIFVQTPRRVTHSIPSLVAMKSFDIKSPAMCKIGYIFLFSLL